MSTYVYRHIEINMKDYNGEIKTRYKEKGNITLTESIPKNIKVGEIYGFYENCHHKYLKIESVNGEEVSYSIIEEKDVPTSWHLVKYYVNGKYGYSDYCEEDAEARDKRMPFTNRFGETINLREERMFCDNGGAIRDNYIGCVWGDSKFRDRGFPEDMSKELFEDLKDDEYAWGKTYVLLSEWGAERDKLIEKFKANVIDRMNKQNNNTIQEKLDFIIRRTRDPYCEPEKKEKTDDTDEEGNIYREDTVDYLFEEDFWDILQVNNEINYANRLVDEIYGWTSPEKIRIVYFCS